MKKTLLGLLATAMLITACQKEAAAPTNEATLVPKCLEGEFIASGITGMFFVKVTNAKIGTTWTPAYTCDNLNNNGSIVSLVGKTFENVIGLNNGAKLFRETNQGKQLILGSKLYFTIDSVNINNLQACPSNGAPIHIEVCTPYPAKEFMFCINTLSTIKCN
jgi:hypothetical protein